MKVAGFGRMIMHAIKGDDDVVATPMAELIKDYSGDRPATNGLRPATLIITSDRYIVNNLYGEMLLTKLGMDPDLDEYPMHHFKVLDTSFGSGAADKEILKTGEAVDYKHERRRIVAVIFDTMVKDVLARADAFRNLGIKVSYSPRVEAVANLIKV